MASTKTAQQIINQCKAILHDPDHVHWIQDDLLQYLNDGQSFVAIHKPSASAKNAVLKLSSGTKQAMPADALQLIDIVRNMGVSGNTPERAIRLVDREVMDTNVPDWHTHKADRFVKHYMYSIKDPLRFYVYPPQPDTNQNYVEMIYGCNPAIVSINNPISIDDIYSEPLVNYILYRAYTRDSEFAADVTRADKHYQLAIAQLTGKTVSENAFNPNLPTSK